MSRFNNHNLIISHSQIHTQKLALPWDPGLFHRNHHFHWGRSTHPCCWPLIQSPKCRANISSSSTVLWGFSSSISRTFLWEQRPAEKKLAPSVADFSSGMKMCYIFSTACTVAITIARQMHWEERGSRLLPLLPTATEDAGRIAWTTLYPHQLYQPITWVRAQGWYAGRDKQGGKSVPCPSSAAPTPSCYGDREFITAVWRELRCPSDKSYPALNHSDWNGFVRNWRFPCASGRERKISGYQQAAKGISFKKCLEVSLHKVKTKDTPLKCSERKSVLGRRGRGCGEGWEQLQRNSMGTDRQAVTKSVNYLKNKLTQKRTSWGRGGGRTSGHPSIIHKTAQEHCE